MRIVFNVSYEIVTQESAAIGDYDETGFAGELLPLREAIQTLFGTRTNRVDCATDVSSDNGTARDLDRNPAPRWITVQNGMEFETGAYESRSLILGDITESSRKRIARLVFNHGG